MKKKLNNPNLIKNNATLKQNKEYSDSKDIDKIQSWKNSISFPCWSKNGRPVHLKYHPEKFLDLFPAVYFLPKRYRVSGRWFTIVRKVSKKNFCNKIS